MYPIPKLFFHLSLVLFLLWTSSCSKSEDGDEPAPDALKLSSVNVGAATLSQTGENIDLPLDQPVVIRFNAALDGSTVQQAVRLLDPNDKPVALTVSLFDDNKTVNLSPAEILTENAVYRLSISGELKGSKKESFDGFTVEFKTLLLPLTLQSVQFDSELFYQHVRMQDVALMPEIKLAFSHAVSPLELAQQLSLAHENTTAEFSVSAATGNKEFIIRPALDLEGLRRYVMAVSGNLISEGGNRFAGLEAPFYTQPDPNPKFPVISDDELLTLVQRQTFKYFWDFAHPVSGLARERNTSGEIVTTGGSGFGLMAILVGIERGFISRTDGVERLRKIVDFLTSADRFHGAWPHWLNGTTGKVRPFSPNDDGGDLVETSFLIAGMLAVRQYLNPADTIEKQLIDRINLLWHAVEWDWYTQGGQKVLYWHWSPLYQWEKNHKIRGYNEALITYVLAASSTTHPVAADAYHEGWAGNGAIKNGRDFYGNNLPLGSDYGGPLFFTHYSFLGINPHDLTDTYANYWTQNVSHSLINRAYCVANANNYVGYSASCWGLTASDGDQGYYAHSPTADRGVITPTAAISSMPFTPEASMEALKFFYYTVGDRLWGDYGFYDAFNPTAGWTADSYLAIDQGPIIIMIENYRSQLLWSLFMSAPEIKAGLTKLGFNIP